MRDYNLDHLLGVHGLATSDYFDLFTLQSTSTAEQRESARELMQQAADDVQYYLKTNYTREP